MAILEGAKASVQRVSSASIGLTALLCGGSRDPLRW
jgi:hypothetical protein